MEPTSMPDEIPRVSPQLGRPQKFATDTPWSENVQRKMSHRGPRHTGTKKLDKKPHGSAFILLTHVFRDTREIARTQQGILTRKGPTDIVQIYSTLSPAGSSQASVCHRPASHPSSS